MLFLNLTYNISLLTQLLSSLNNRLLAFIKLPSSNMFKTSLLFREGFFIDELQRTSFDKLTKKLLVTSTQLFNINFYNYKFIKFLIDDVYKLFNNLVGDTSQLSLSFILKSLIFYFLFLFNLIISLYFLFL